MQANAPSSRPPSTPFTEDEIKLEAEFMQQFASGVPLTEIAQKMNEAVRARNLNVRTFSANTLYHRRAYEKKKAQKRAREGAGEGSDQALDAAPQAGLGQALVPDKPKQVQKPLDKPDSIRPSTDIHRILKQAYENEANAALMGGDKPPEKSPYTNAQAPDVFMGFMPPKNAYY